MNHADRQARNEEIVRLKCRGLTNAQVATGLKVSTDTVQRAMRDWRATAPKLRDNNPLEIIDDMIDGYMADISELATISSGTTNPSARVGAINARMGARDRIIALLQATGVLPHDLGKLSIEMDVRYISQRVLVVFDKYNVPLEAREELLSLLASEDSVASAN